MSDTEKRLIRSLNHLDNIVRDLDVSKDIAPTPKEVVSDLVPRLMMLAKVQMEQKTKLNLRQDKESLEAELKTDTFQLLRGLFNQSEVCFRIFK